MTEELIKSFEKLRLKSYHGEADREGIVTIGWGHVLTGHEVPDLFKPGDVMSTVTITEQQAEQLFKNDVEKFVTGVNMRLDAAKRKNMTDDQFGAFVSFAYNVGLSNFNASKVRSTFNFGNTSDVPPLFGHFISSNGQVVDGLIRRRAAEAALYQSDYVNLDFFQNKIGKSVMGAARIYLQLDGGDDDE